MKPDEEYFLKRVQAECGLAGHWPRIWPRDIINEPGFPLHYKRAWYLLEKWTAKDWYEYGTTLDLGWMTEKGMVIEFKKKVEGE